MYGTQFRCLGERRNNFNEMNDTAQFSNGPAGSLFLLSSLLIYIKLGG